MYIMLYMFGYMVGAWFIVLRYVIILCIILCTFFL